MTGLFPSTSSKRLNKVHCSPRDRSLSVNYSMSVTGFDFFYLVVKFRVFKFHDDFYSWIYNFTIQSRN